MTPRPQAPGSFGLFSAATNDAVAMTAGLLPDK